MPSANVCASMILAEFDQAQTELVGKAVILTDGKAGTVERVWLDELHGRESPSEATMGSGLSRPSNSCSRTERSPLVGGVSPTGGDNCCLDAAARELKAEKPVLPKQQFIQPFQVDFTRPVLPQKIFRFLIPPNQMFPLPRPASTRGALRDRHDTRGGMRWTRCVTRRMMLSRTAKSCGPGVPTLALRFVDAIHEVTVAKEPGHRGEHEGNR
jgi:hypothetical protein